MQKGSFLHLVKLQNKSEQTEVWHCNEYDSVEEWCEWCSLEPKQIEALLVFFFFNEITFRGLSAALSDSSFLWIHSPKFNFRQPPLSLWDTITELLHVEWMSIHHCFFLLFVWLYRKKTLLLKTMKTYSWEIQLWKSCIRIQ